MKILYYMSWIFFALAILSGEVVIILGILKFNSDVIGPISFSILINGCFSVVCTLLYWVTED